MSAARSYVSSSQRSTVSNKTINNRLSVLSTLLRYAFDLGIAPEPKLRFHIKATSADVPAVPMDDVRKLVAEATLFYQAAILLAAEAGLRVGEIRGLQWSDVRGRGPIAALRGE